MNINITPSAVAVDTAANLLAFLEMAKDPSKLKAVLDQIKTAQDAAAAEAEAAKAAKKEALDIMREANEKSAAADRAAVTAREDSSRAAAASADAAAMRDSMKEERNKFDNWMAAEREKLAADQAKVKSDAAQNASMAEALAGAEKDAIEYRAEADRAMAAAEALRAEYEQKIAALKSMI